MSARLHHSQTPFQKARQALWDEFQHLLPAAVRIGVVLLCCTWLAQSAAPPAGTSIGNQASATYTDSSGVSRTATSNVAITIIQQVASFTLTADNTRVVSPGGQASFPHTIVNTGNGMDSFSLSVAQLAGDNFDLTGVGIYADANGDGIPDNTTAITTTPNLPAGVAFKFVVVATAPGTTTDGQTAQLRVNAASAFNAAVTAFNTDTAVVSANAVISVTKAINISSGASPSGPYTYTLAYNNTGNSTATSLMLMDVIPAGMSYVAGSGRWSGSGATALTDEVGNDPAGILYDLGVAQAGRVTAVIATVAPGQSGTLTFQVTVNGGLPPSTINNVATYVYDPGTGTSVGPYTSNGALFTVNQVANVSITGQTIASATQGSTVAFTNTVVNTGNVLDSFEVLLGSNTFPPGTTFALYQSDGMTSLMDHDNDGIPATPPIAPGASYNVIVKAVLPSTATGAGPFTLQKIARSNSDYSKTATATDTLNAITANTVDLTNDSAGSGAPGAGPGPEATPVKTVAVNPGQTARFTLYVNNTSGVADSYNLAGSTDPNFTTLAFPTGWSVTFRDANGAVITTTGVLPPGGSKLVYAEIFVPEKTPPGTYLGYWRALSPTSGAQDRKKDAVVVNTLRALKLEPNNTGQVSPGGSVVYSHYLKNDGNVVEGDGTSSTVLVTSDSQPGFTSVIYWDQNNNGVLDPTDPVLRDLSTLTGGINGASTAAGLDPGETARIFVKVFAPVGATPGSIDSTALTATTTGGVGTVPPLVQAVDTTTVISGDVVLTKEQALDVACDGTPDGPYSKANVTTGAVPGACIRYRVTVSNNGSTPATDLLLSDSTPAFTTYTATVPAATTKGTVVSTPVDGGVGTLQFNIGTLNPGESAIITFGVRINQ